MEFLKFLRRRMQVKMHFKVVFGARMFVRVASAVMCAVDERRRYNVLGSIDVFSYPRSGLSRSDKLQMTEREKLNYWIIWYDYAIFSKYRHLRIIWKVSVIIPILSRDRKM